MSTYTRSSSLNQSVRRALPLVPNYIVLTLLLLFAILPLSVLFFNSVKTQEQVAYSPLGLPTGEIRWQNFADAWIGGNYATTMRNSIVITGGTIVLVLLVAGLGGYALARLDYKHGNTLTMYLVVTSTLPSQLFMVPLFFLWRQLGLTDNLLGLIIIYAAVNIPFATFLLRSFMMTIPRELDEAARVDGANEWQIFWRVIVPITWPGFMTTGLLVGLYAWNEFPFAVTFVHNANLKPISTSLYAFVGRFDRDWGLTSAASIIMIAPVIVLFLLLQRRFIAGLTQGSVKA
jgi:raffinose/stachyose/melibiose transport system permease protein